MEGSVSGNHRTSPALDPKKRGGDGPTNHHPSPSRMHIALGDNARNHCLSAGVGPAHAISSFSWGGQQGTPRP